nr:hypothetical protein [Tanacetum cinerariifolium]
MISGLEEVRYIKEPIIDLDRPMGLKGNASWVVGHSHMGVLGEGVGTVWVKDIKEKDKIRAKTRQNQEQTESMEKSKVNRKSNLTKSKPSSLKSQKMRCLMCKFYRDKQGGVKFAKG